MDCLLHFMSYGVNLIKIWIVCDLNTKFLYFQKKLMLYFIQFYLA